MDSFQWVESLVCAAHGCYSNHSDSPYPGSLVWLWYVSNLVLIVCAVGYFPHRDQSVRWFSALRSRYSQRLFQINTQKPIVFRRLVHYKIPTALPYFSRAYVWAFSNKYERFRMVQEVLMDWILLDPVEEVISYDLMFAIILLISAISLLVCSRWPLKTTILKWRKDWQTCKVVKRLTKM